MLCWDYPFKPSNPPNFGITSCSGAFRATLHSTDCVDMSPDEEQVFAELFKADNVLQIVSKFTKMASKEVVNLDLDKDNIIEEKRKRTQRQRFSPTPKGARSSFPSFNALNITHS